MMHIINTNQYPVKVKVVNKSKHSLPSYKNKADESDRNSGMDVRANIDSPVILGPGEIKIIPTGLFVKLPEGYEIQVRPRSGLAAKYGITVLNTPGTIDESYVNLEIKVILINLGTNSFTINDGDRIAQLVLAPVTKCEWDTNWVPVEDDLDRTGGIGHSNI